MNSTIKELNEKEKTILHLALVDLKEKAEHRHTEAVRHLQENPDNDTKKAVIGSMAWMEKNVNGLMNKLFDDTFVNDHSYLDQLFEQEQEAKQNQSNSDTTNPV